MDNTVITVRGKRAVVKGREIGLGIETGKIQDKVEKVQGIRIQGILEHDQHDRNPVQVVVVVHLVQGAEVEVVDLQKKLNDWQSLNDKDVKKS